MADCHKMSIMSCAAWVAQGVALANPEKVSIYDDSNCSPKFLHMCEMFYLMY